MGAEKIRAWYTLFAHAPIKLHLDSINVKMTKMTLPVSNKPHHT